MPRTFSRGEPFDSTKVIDIAFQHLSESEFIEFSRQMRLLICPEAGLIEQDIGDFIDLLFDRLNFLERLIENMLNRRRIITTTAANDLHDWRKQTLQATLSIQRRIDDAVANV